MVYRTGAQPRKVKTSLHVSNFWRCVPLWFRILVLLAGSLAVLDSLIIMGTHAGALISLPLVCLAPVFAIWLAMRANRSAPIPTGVLVWMFGWGAGVATLVSGFVNSAVMGAMGEFVTVTVSAPLIEESMKLLAILAVARAAGSVDNPVSGMVAGIVVGAGFTLVEDIGYLLEGVGAGETLFVAFGRAITKPFLHMTTTALSGYAVGSMLMRRGRGASTLWLVPAGYAIHAIWNLGASTAGGLILVAGFGLTAGFFGGVQSASRAQVKRLRVGADRATGLLRQSEVLMVGSRERVDSLLSHHQQSRAEIFDWLRACSVLAECVSYHVRPMPERYLNDLHYAREAFFASLNGQIDGSVSAPGPVPLSPAGGRLAPGWYPVLGVMRYWDGQSFR